MFFSVVFVDESQTGFQVLQAARRIKLSSFRARTTTTEKMFAAVQVVVNQLTEIQNLHGNLDQHISLIVVRNVK